MGESESSSIENNVVLSERCEKKYAKMAKKGDPILLKEINDSFQISDGS